MSVLISRIPNNSTLFVLLREEKQKFKIYFHYSLFWAHFSAAGNIAANQQASPTFLNVEWLALWKLYMQTIHLLQ